MPQSESRPARLMRLLLLPVQAIIAFFIFIDELVRPLYGPLVRWFGSLRLVEWTQSLIAQLPRFVILILLLVPIAIAEPLKVYGLFEIGEGRLGRGIFLLVLAYLASFLVIERIYEAGKPKLLTIGWFAGLVGFIAWFRGLMLARLRQSRVWALLEGTRHAVRRLIATIKAGR